MTGALVHSACNELARQAFKAAGRNYHAEKLATEHERMRRYYIALYAEMERCRVAQVPMLIGAGIEYGVPNAPDGVAIPREDQR